MKHGSKQSVHTKMVRNHQTSKKDQAWKLVRFFHLFVLEIQGSKRVPQSYLKIRLPKKLDDFIYYPLYQSD